jgi:hypothetical protein
VANALEKKILDAFAESRLTGFADDFSTSYLYASGGTSAFLAEAKR